jgi:hypothetical protein
MLLVDIITLWTGALVGAWHEFLYPTSKKVVAKCEIRAVIRVLQAEGHSAAEIHGRMSAVYGPNFVRDTCYGVVQKISLRKSRRAWWGGQGWPSLVIDDLVQHVENLFSGRRGFSLSDLSLEVLQVSRTILYETVTKKTWPPQVLCQMGAQLPGGNFLWCGIQKLVSRSDKCLNSEGDYVDK